MVPVMGAAALAFCLALAVMWASSEDVRVRASGDADSVVLPPKLLVHVDGGKVSLAVMAHWRCGPVMVVRRDENGGVEVALTGNPTERSLIDEPGAGVWVYELRLRPPGDGSKDSRAPLDSRRVSMVRSASLTFIGGTAKRGLFEHVAADGSKTRFFVPVGMPVGAAVLVEGRDPGNDVAEIVTGLRLVEVRMAAAKSAGAPEAVAVGDGKGGWEPVLGIDGKPLALPKAALRTGPERMAAVVEWKDGRREVVAEGESVSPE